MHQTNHYLWTLGVLLIVSVGQQAPAQDILYDNSQQQLPSNGGRIGPSPGDTFLAQPFNLGSHDNISAVNINLSRIGDPDPATIRFSVWDDNGSGFPGQHVADIGEVDVSQLDDLGLRPRVLPSVTFETSVTGLTPMETYFLVTDLRDFGAWGSQDDPNSAAFGAVRNQDGTNEASEWLAARPRTEPPFNDNQWSTLTQLGFGRAWMQMSIMAALAELLGDVNEDGTLDVVDIDTLASAVRQGFNDPRYDVNNDGHVNRDDLTYWLKSSEVANTFFGDANLDGEFNSGDLTLVFQAGEYEDIVELNSTWAEGDWNGDGDFGSEDLVVAFQDGGYELRPKAAVQAIPEPSSLVMIVLGILTLAHRIRPL